jgi:hypothetical protein
MAAHTPGPWEIDGDWIITADAGIPICELPLDNEVEWGAPDLIAEVKSTARLISAAPDLLAALQELVGQRDAHFHTVPAWDAARAAIAKATGA